jgi:hypothetical protein
MAGSLGFLFGMLTMTWEVALSALGTGPPADPFFRSPEAMVWIFLIAAQFSFWSSAVPFQWHGRSTVKHEFQIRFNTEIAAKLVVAIALFAVPASLMAHALPATHLPHHHAKSLLVNLLGVVVALVSVEGIWYVRAALSSRPWNATADAGGARAKDDVRSYLVLRDSLQLFITFLGAMIGLATLAKGAARHSFVATGGPPGDYPPEFVLLYGAYFTGLLALVYIPTYTRLVTVGQTILDTAFPFTSPDVELTKLADWQSHRKSLEELLQLRATALDNLRASVSILAPLASSAISILLGDKLMLSTK